MLTEIAEEELVHAGEFFCLPHALAPEQAKLYAKGAKEVEKSKNGMAKASLKRLRNNRALD